MANYIVSGSKFRPFSYAEMLQPVQSATVAHQELENQYGELATKASVWEEMANEQTDPYAYKMYKTYANDLEEQVGQLAREGLNAASRRDMLNMRARYSKEITPIEQAYTARQKQAEKQQQSLLQDPSLIFSRNAATTSLDEYIRNPQLDYDVASGKMVMAQVQNAASALTKEINKNPREWRSILGGQYFETAMKKGLTTQEVLDVIRGNRDASPILTKIIEDAVTTSKVRDWKDDRALKAIYSWANQGAWGAVGDTQYQTLQNQGYMNPLQRLQYKKALQEEEAVRNSLNYKPRTLSHLEVQKRVPKITNAVNNLKVKDGKGLKASYFGKRGEANPLKVYEEYQKLMRLTGTELYQAQYGRTVSEEEKRKDAMATLKKKYGVDKVITPEEYESLKLLGYNEKSSFKDFKDVDIKVDDTIKNYTEWFLNGDISHLGKIYGNNITSMNKNGKSFANAVTILDENFNATSDKFDPDDFGEDNPVVDFSHSTKHRDKVIVSYKDGTKVAVNPDVISGEMKSLFDLYENERRNMLKEGYSEREVNNYLEMYLMQGMTDLGLRGFNQGIPATNSSLEEKQ